MEVKNRTCKPNALIHHSDRGLQYCSNQYQSGRKKSKLQYSMKESYDSFVNAVAERINGILKAEF
jgi:transposase InsO family protein